VFALDTDHTVLKHCRPSQVDKLRVPLRLRTNVV
jgi:hypothetical protein